MDPTDTTVTRERFKRRARDVAGQFIIDNLWRILIGIASFFSGGAVTYVAIVRQLDHAVVVSERAESNTERLERKIDLLVTKQELQDVKQWVGTLEDRLDYAKEQAGTPPTARRSRKK